MSTRELRERTVDLGGRDVGILERGDGESAVVLLHGGTPGVTPYVACADLWVPLIDALGPELRILAIELTCSRSDPAQGAQAALELLVSAGADLVRSVLDQLGIRRAVLVGHDRGAVVALLLARSPSRDSVAGVVGICPVGAAPLGDGPANLTLLHSPLPLWSAESQRWAITRLSHRLEAVTPALIEDLVRRAGSEPYQRAIELAADDSVALALEADRLAARAELNAYCRDVGYEVPISLVVGSRDPLLPVPVANGLFEILATTRAHLELNVVSDVGHFAFREDPGAVARVIEPFVALAFGTRSERCPTS